MTFRNKRKVSRRQNIAKARQAKHTSDDNQELRSETGQSVAQPADDQSVVNEENNKRSIGSIEKSAGSECIQVLDCIFTVSDPQAFVCKECKCFVKDPVAHLKHGHRLSDPCFKTIFAAPPELLLDAMQ